MAISHVNTTTYGPNGTTNTSVINSVPSGVQDGDLLLWSLSVSGTSPANPSPPAGWSSWQATFGNGANIEITIFYRIASSEPASYSMLGLSSGRWTGLMSAYRGVDQMTPKDTANTTATGSAPPSITTVTANTYVLVHGKALSTSGGTGSNWTSSTGTISGQVTQTQGAATNDTQGTSYQPKVTIGATTPDLAVAGATPYTGQIRITSALREAPARPQNVRTFNPALMRASTW